GDALGRYTRWKQQLFYSYAVVLLGSVLAVWRFGRLIATRQLFSTLPFLLLFAGMLALHLGVIVLGRMNLRPNDMVLVQNSYYAYTPLCFLLVGAYFLWVRITPNWTKLESTVLLFLLFAFGAITDC